jgi:hypothetical protein
MFWPLGSIWVFWKCPYFMTNKAVSRPAEPFVSTPFKETEGLAASSRQNQPQKRPVKDK